MPLTTPGDRSLSLPAGRSQIEFCSHHWTRREREMAALFIGELRRGGLEEALLE